VHSLSLPVSLFKPCCLCPTSIMHSSPSRPISTDDALIMGCSRYQALAHSLFVTTLLSWSDTKMEARKSKVEQCLTVRKCY
jgi:hypothetical protein